MTNKSTPMFLLTQQINAIGQAIENSVKEKFMGVTIPINFCLEVTSKQSNNALPIRSFSIVNTDALPEHQYNGPSNFGPNSYGSRPPYAQPKIKTNSINVINSNAGPNMFSVLYDSFGFNSFVSEHYSFEQTEKAASAIFKSLMDVFLEVEHNNSTERFKRRTPGEHTFNEQQMPRWASGETEFPNQATSSINAGEAFKFGQPQQTSVNKTVATKKPTKK